MCMRHLVEAMSTDIQPEKTKSVSKVQREQVGKAVQSEKWTELIVRRVERLEGGLAATPAKSMPAGGRSDRTCQRDKHKRSKWPT